MDTKELQAEIKNRIQKSYSNPTTVSQYMGGVSRVLKRVPIELFGNVAVIRLYRQLLSAPTRKVFATAWRKIFDVMTEAGMACVPPEELSHQTKMPVMLSRAMDFLASRSSLAVVGSFRWKDVEFGANGEVRIWQAILGPTEIPILEQVAEYCWPGQTPPPEAPIIPLSPECPMVPMPPEMVEDAVNDLNSGGGYGVESETAYRLYDVLCDAGMPLADIEYRLEALIALESLKRAPRARAHDTMREVMKAAKAGDRSEFERLWNIAMSGESGVLRATPVTPPTYWTPTPRQLVHVDANGKWRKPINVAPETNSV